MRGLPSLKPIHAGAFFHRPPPSAAAAPPQADPAPPRHPGPCRRCPLRFTEPVAFDVFDSRGRYLGPVTVPPSFRTDPQPIFRGDHVWAITRDEMDVPRIVRYRLRRGRSCREADSALPVSGPDLPGSIVVQPGLHEGLR